MPYLICKKCNGYYELQQGESIEDFEECECGGNLNQVESLDIPYNKQRVKTIIETFKNDSESLKEKPKHAAQNQKLSINVDYSEGITRLLKENKNSKKDTPAELQRSALKEMASIPELYNFDFIGPIDEDTSQEIMKIIAEVVYDGKGIIDATREIVSRTSLSYDDAVHISRNEISRIKNLGNWFIHKEKGYNYFKISKSFNACKKCNKTYDNMIFTMEQVEMLPPLHDLCTCNAIFYKEEK
jgi:hypothetical protein